MLDSGCANFYAPANWHMGSQPILEVTQTPLISSGICANINSWLGILYIFPPHVVYTKTMNFPAEQLQTVQTKVTETVQTVTNNETIKQFVMFIVTVAAVIVGFAQFVQQTWVQNDMTTKVRNFTYKTLTVVYNLSHNLAMIIEEKEMAV